MPLQKEVQWNPEAFSKMPNLKLLKIRNVQLLHGVTHFPNALRFLEWSGYPLKSLPPNFQPDQLVELNMCHSKIELLWEGVKVMLFTQYLYIIPYRKKLMDALRALI